MLEVPTSVVYAYSTDLAMEYTIYEEQSVRQIVEVEFNVLSLSAFLRLVRCGAVRQLLFERMMVGCVGYGTFLRIPVAIVNEWLGLSVLCLIHNMEVGPVLALFVMALLAVVDWVVSPDLE